MIYSSPKEYIRVLDQVYFKYVTIPILIFFAYYVYFLRNSGRNQLFEPELKYAHILAYVLVWIIPVVFLIMKNSKIKTEVRLQKDLDAQMEAFKELIKSKIIVDISLFLLAVLVFAASNHNLMSLPIWIMFVLLSIDKPNIYKLSRYLKFNNKEAHDAFLKDSWL